MAAGPDLIPLDQARAILLAGVSPLGSERVALGEGGGRTLAADVLATRDQPPAPLSAMDGYAVREGDSAPGKWLTVIGDAPAGRPFAGAVGDGQAVQVATGAVVPDGAERIVVQEIVERDGARMRLVDKPGAATFIRDQGCDFRAGEVLVRSGAVLTAARLGLVAAANHGEIDVRARPRVLILASGDELREPGSPLGPGMIVNSASFALAGLIAAWGGVATRAPILSDDFEQCLSQVKQAGSAADVFVPLGGASVGERDVLRPVIERLGARILFDRIAVQPGKPCWHARFADGPLVLGLPGNPASAFVCAHLLLRPVISALLGRESRVRLVKAALTAPMPKGASREVYWRATLAIDDQGKAVVTPDPRLDSSLQLPLASANALIRRTVATPPSEAGDLVDVLPLD